MRFSVYVAEARYRSIDANCGLEATMSAPFLVMKSSTCVPGEHAPKAKRAKFLKSPSC